MNGQVVRGVAGKRSEYRPIQSSIAADAHPATVARAFVERFGFETVYVADIDAIQGRPPNREGWEAIRDAGLKIWLDAGAGDPLRYCELVESLLSKGIRGAIVIGLESLQDPYDDRWWSDSAGSDFPPIFSLDLKESVPLRQALVWPDRSALEIAREAYHLGFRDIIVLDLADVGMDHGTRTLNLCEQLVKELTEARVIAGGGVRDSDDLRSLAVAGCHAALVASALHDGRLTADELGQAGSLSY